MPSNYIPPFQFGKYTVEAWGHRSGRGEGGTEMVWSIRVDETLLGSLVTEPDISEQEVTRRIKHWIVQNLPK
jgi:hypothetical protein